MAGAPGVRVVTAADIMRPATTTVERGAHIAAAAYLMKQHGAGALVVTTDDEQRLPIAIVTEKDIAEVVADGRGVNNTRISDLVGRTPVTVTSDMPVATAAETMLRTGAHHVPVVDDGRLVGIVDMSDACRGLLESSAAQRQLGAAPA